MQLVNFNEVLGDHIHLNVSTTVVAAWEAPLLCLCFWVTHTILSFNSLFGKLSYLLCSILRIVVAIVQSLTHVQPFVTPWNTACQAPLSFTISQSLLRFMSTELVMLSKHLIFCHPLLLLPSIFSNIRVFSNESGLYTRRPKYWSFSISTSKEYSGCFFFRIDLFDLLAVQGTLKSLLRNHSWKASILQCSAFFVVSGPDPMASHYQPMPPPETPRHTQASLAQCLWDYSSFLLVLRLIQSALFMPESLVTPVLGKFCNQILLTFKVRFPGDTQSLSQTPRLGSLLWGLELS